MPPTIRSTAQLAEVVAASAIAPWLARRAGWTVDPPTVGPRQLEYVLRHAGDELHLQVGLADAPGGAAFAGRALRVVAPRPPSDVSAFDTLGRAIVALDLVIELDPGPTPARVQIARGGALYNSARQERAFHLVNLGMPRTGTTTVTAMFRAWRSAQEYWSEPICDALVARASDEVLLAALREREAAGRLEVDSASFLQFAPEPVLRLYPDAQYVMTWRSFAPWMDSFVQMLLREHDTQNPAHRSMIAMCMGPCDRSWFASVDACRTALESVVEHALAFYTEGLTRCLDVLPPRALVIATTELDAAAERLARLVGIEASTLVLAHENLTEYATRWSDQLTPALRAHVGAKIAPVVRRLELTSGR